MRVPGGRSNKLPPRSCGSGQAKKNRDSAASEQVTDRCAVTLVTMKQLSQASGIAESSLKSRRQRDRDFPQPMVKPGRTVPHQFDWQLCRDYFHNRLGIDLPENPPIVAAVLKAVTVGPGAGYYISDDENGGNVVAGGFASMDDAQDHIRSRLRNCLDRYSVKELLPNAHSGP